MTDDPAFTEVRRFRLTATRRHWCAVDAAGHVTATACGPGRVRNVRDLTRAFPEGTEPDCPICLQKYHRARKRAVSAKYRWPRWVLRQGRHHRQAARNVARGMARTHLVAVDAQGTPVGTWCRSFTRPVLTLEPDVLPFGAPTCEKCGPGWPHVQGAHGLMRGEAPEAVA